MKTLNEFDLIRTYFTRSDRKVRSDSILTVGDDCAITQVNNQYQLAITTDTLVEGTHFYPNINPSDLAYKSIAVNLSDLAAMGAIPAWVSLAITLPEIDTDWLKAFSQSFLDTLSLYNVDLIGGDTTKGHLSVTITAHGLLPKEKALYRHTAKAGDYIYVTGSLGDSAAGLELLANNQNLSNHSNSQTVEQHLLTRHLRPTPRVAFGQMIASYASAAIDISDGLLADLRHILQRSNVGAELHLEKLPLSDALIQYAGKNKAQQFALSGGEDYELCFCVPSNKVKSMEKALSTSNVDYICIGQTRDVVGINLFDHGCSVDLPTTKGFDHFRK